MADFSTAKMKINGYDIAYPKNFDMEKQEHIVSEITTMSGKKLMDYNGWSYADITFEWEYLTEAELQILINQTTPNRGPFTLGFLDEDNTFTYINAVRKGVVKSYTRYRDYFGNIMWENVKMSVIFPDVYQY